MSDEELLSLFENPETRRNAFNQLVRKYQQKVYWLVRKMVVDHDDANDIPRMYSSKHGQRWKTSAAMPSCIPGFTALPATRPLIFSIKSAGNISFRSTMSRMS